MRNEQTDFADYDHWFRKGVFDKCNGRAPAFIRDETDLAVSAYFDGFDGNEVKIVEEMEIEFTPEDTVWRVWAEWDMGQEYLVFSSEDAAIHWADHEIGNDADLEFANFSEARDEGLAGLTELKLLS
jgi:hypothetical protein